METGSVKLVYFSPTGTTRNVVEGIVRGIDAGRVDTVDITRPGAREVPLQLEEDELLILGVPVYMGRVPALLTDWLHAMTAKGTPAVPVVVYGNRVYDDALIELADIITERGCRPVAGGAWIGEHSFSTDATPTAKDRPDAGDLDTAVEFGKKIRKKLDRISSVENIPYIQLPGSRPYRGDPKLWNVDFIAVSDACTQCGTCAELCPVGAIDSTDGHSIDTGRCITCCACIRYCPELARSMKPGLVMDASLRLHTLYKERKEPEYFLD